LDFAFLVNIFKWKSFSYALVGLGNFEWLPFPILLFSFEHAFPRLVVIEGGCRWGFDMIWEYPEPDESKMT